jgi:hypothetical protein
VAETRPATSRLLSVPDNLTGLIEEDRVGDRLPSPRDEAQDNGDGNDPEYSEEGCQPIQFFGIVDLEASRISGGLIVAIHLFLLILNVVDEFD